MAELERRFGVKLIDRSPHSFRVTDVGQDFYERCRAMLLEADRARAAVFASKGEPEGVLRLSCPTVPLDACVSNVIPEFLELYPRVDLHALAIDRHVDLVEERIHVAIRPLTRAIDESADTTVTRLGPSRDILVASPALARSLALGAVVELERSPTVSLVEPASEWVDVDQWTLGTDEDESVVISHRPRLHCRNVQTAMSAVLAGRGIGLLPEKSCASALATGALVRVLPERSRLTENLGLVTTQRRGMPSAVTALVEFLVARLGDDPSNRSDGRASTLQPSL